MNKIIIYSGVAILAGIGLGTISMATALISKIVVITGFVGVCIGLNERKHEKLPCKDNG